MVEGLPVTFPIPGESAIASYPYSDIKNGTGWVTYYLAKASIATTTYVYMLHTDSSLYSANGGYKASFGSFEEDFDVTFAAPKNIKGDLFVTIPLAVYNASAPASIEADVTIIKLVGAVETTIGTTQRSEVFTCSSGWKRGYATMKFTIAQTHFKIGESLRITIKGYSSSATVAAIGFSPVGTQQTAAGDYFEGISTRATAYVPFRLND